MKPSLGRLETLRPGTNAEYEEKIPLNAIEPLLFLKSIHECYAVSWVVLNDGHTGYEFKLYAM